jgi:hypothetical protein
MRSRGDTRVDTGVGSFLCLQGFERNLRPSSIYTGDWTPPPGRIEGPMKVRQDAPATGFQR